MARKRNRHPVIENVKLSQMAAEGKAWTRLENGKVLFVEDAVPDDVADIWVEKNKNDYAQGRIQRLISPSPLRTTPFCEHFGVCGGCKWQYLPYPQQAIFKQHIISETFRRIAKNTQFEVLPFVAAEQNTYYRNKLEFTFSDRRWLYPHEMDSETHLQHNGVGFHVPRSFSKVLDIQHCYLQPSPSNELRNAVRDFALKNNLSFYDLRNHGGFLRNLIVRTASTGEWMATFSFGEDHALRSALLDFVVGTFPDITSLQYAINSKRNDTLFDQDIITHYGKGFITEQLGSLKFKISPKSFFQTNTAQGLRLYEITKEMAQLTGEETVYDLYTGTGSIALFLADRAKQVIGVEEIGDAIEDARYNAALNGIEHCEFYTADVKKWLQGQQAPRPDVVVLDPPRAGLHADVIPAIVALAPRRIVYVSCNPATQARDIALFAPHYQLVSMRGVDMFPHTYHIENVACLELS